MSATDYLMLAGYLASGLLSVGCLALVAWTLTD